MSETIVHEVAVFALCDGLTSLSEWHYREIESLWGRALISRSVFGWFVANNRTLG